MYIRQSKYDFGTYYDSDGSQHAARADYLMLVCPRGNKPLYACVRKVAMMQVGNFMMGVARVAGQSITLSGSIGHDGLPLDWEDLTEKAKEKFKEVPADVAATYWANDGWNDVGKARGVLTEYGKSIS